MTFEQARNAIVTGLENHIGCSVMLSNQIAEISDYPYCYYSVLTSRITSHSFGLHEVQTSEGVSKFVRSEPVTATISFTFCSMNHESGDEYIFGEDEALALAEKAFGFFLLNGHNIHTEYGDVVINNVGAVSNRTGFFVEDTIRRYGFDIRIAYVRTDEMPTITVANPNRTPGKTYL